MELNLRKAAALQNSINDVIRNIKFVSNVTITEFEDPEKILNAAIGEFQRNENRRERLTRALYEIRRAVANANATAGVDDLLANIAELDRTIEFYNGLADSEVRKSLDVLEKQLEKLRNRKDESAYRLFGDVSTSIFSSDDLTRINRIVSDSKRAKQTAQDKLLEINVATKIAIDSITEDFLRSEGLV